MNVQKPFVAILAFFIILAVKAQSSILFKSGNYEPQANLDVYLGNPQLFEEQLFNNTWYGVFQFAALPSTEQQAYLNNQGVRIVGYIPNNAYVVSVPKQAGLKVAKTMGVRSLFQLHPQHKMTAALYNGEIPDWAVSMPGMIDITAELYEGVKAADFIKTMRTTMVTLLSDEPSLHKITLRIPAKSIREVASSPVVLWVQPIMPKVVAENVPGKNLSRSNVLTDGIRNLSGKNVIMGIWDGGVVGPHIDFSGRLSVEEPGTSNDHATHVAGTMAGAGNIDPKARGMAPKAQIFGYDFNGSIASEINSSIINKQIVISQHSYGYGNSWVNCTSKDPYVLESREQDLTVAANPYFMHVHSAGNSQSVCTSGWGTTTGKAAKNILVVANVASTETINSSSSFGPVSDGRLKPEISALGVDVFSSGPNNTYLSGYTGTSMATPVVSGVSAQLYERYRQLNANQNPAASLLKAVMCNTAKDVGTAGPDYKYGYGVLNGLKAVKVLEANTYAMGMVAQNGFSAQSIVVPAGATRLKVMISWTDEPALANANPALVNDLDLVVRDPNNTTTLPWKLNAASPATAATRAVDRLNNTEQVTIDNPVAGTYQLEVTGFAVPMGVQTYAITWEVETPFMTLTYPTGGEHLVPGSTATIHWDNAGVTGTQTLQYSTNGGGSWTNISTTIAAATKQYTWTVPSLNGVKALVRISSGSLSDESDDAFFIINTPSSLTLGTGCSAGEVKLSWSAVTGATHYDILKLDTVTGDWDTATHDVAGITGTVTGLNPGSMYWLAVLARNNTVGVIGERSLAKSFIVPTTAPSPGIIIESVSSSNTNLCEGGTTTLTATAKLIKTSLPNYVFSTSTSGSLDPMLGATTVVPSGEDDVPSSLQSIGFTFNFDQVDYTAFSVSPDGWLKLGDIAGTDEYANNILSTTNTPKLYPYWDDIATGSTGSVKTVLTGTAPNRILIVQWFVTIPRNTTGAANSTFQLWLYETSNKIEFRYGTMGSTTTASASSGLTTAGASNYRSITFSSHTQSASSTNNSNTTPPASGRLYAFALPTASASSITWSPANYLNTTTGAIVNVQNIASPITYTLTTTDASGCTASSPYPLSPFPKPKVGFTINNPTQPRNTNAFVLNDTTNGNWLTRIWTYGDGNTGTTNPVTKSYAAIGTYNVKLRVNTLYGCTDSLQKQVNVVSSTPSVYASALQFSNITGTSMQLTWTNGNGQQRIVLAKLNSAVNTTLADNNTYPANTQFGAGTQLADGSYVIYQGTANTTTVTGLNILSNYHFAVVELSIDNGVNMYQPLPYLTGQNTTLPVKWLSFEALLNNANTIDLTWSTASEVNNRGFEVQRSEDVKRWITLATVKGNGTTGLTSYYNYTDATKGLDGMVYYRLKQMDYNGRFEYSAIRSVNLKGETQTFHIYPNPATQLVYIDYADKTGVDIEVVDITGKVVYNQTGYVAGNPINLNTIPEGLYSIRLLKDNVQVYATKLILQH